MARNSNRGQYDRPSWREIDAKRGKKREPAAAKPEKEPDRWQQKQRDEKFDLLFSDPNKELARKKIVECLGKETFIPAVDAYRAEYGIPEDFDILQQIFENHPDASLKVQVLEKMDTLVDATAESTRQVFKSRIKLLKMTARDPDLKKLAVRIAKARAY